jgi:hypothetical protein
MHARSRALPAVVNPFIASHSLRDQTRDQIRFAGGSRWGGDRLVLVRSAVLVYWPRATHTWSEDTISSSAKSDVN